MCVAIPISPATMEHEMSDLGVLLSHRDLLTAGLTVFGNRPETYVAWKSMFHNATADLNLKCCEELDPLTRYKKDHKDRGRP